MTSSAQQLNIKEKREWQNLVIHEQRNILANMSKTPTQKLMGVFELFIPPFPVNYLKEVKLYDKLLSLSEIYKNNPKTFWIGNEFLIQQILQIFVENKEEIRKYSTELYYALLDFRDFMQSNGIH